MRIATSAIYRSSSSSCLKLFDERREESRLVMQVIEARMAREYKESVRNPIFHFGFFHSVECRMVLQQNTDSVLL